MFTNLSIVSMDRGRGINVPDPVPNEDFVPPLPSRDPGGFRPGVLLTWLCRSGRRAATALKRAQAPLSLWTTEQWNWTVRHLKSHRPDLRWKLGISRDGE